MKKVKKIKIGALILIIIAILFVIYLFSLSPTPVGNSPPDSSCELTTYPPAKTIEKKGSCTCTTIITDQSISCRNIETNALISKTDLTTSVRIWIPLGCGPSTTNPTGNYDAFTSITGSSSTSSATTSISIGHSIILDNKGNLVTSQEPDGTMPSCF